MADTSGTPFEDGPPAAPAARPPADPGAVVGLPSDPVSAQGATAGAAAGLGSRAVSGDGAPGDTTSTVPASTALTGTGPAPGSPEEAAIILRALADASGSTSSSWAKPGLIAGTALIVVVTVVGLVLGAEYLRHVAGSSSSAGGDGGIAPALSVTETNLKAVLSTVLSFRAAHGGTLLGLTPAVLADANPSLTFPSVSGTSSEIAIASPVTGSLVLTSFQSSPAACVGVLLVSSQQGAPIFSEDQATADAGTYYFEALAPAGLCNALTVVPPAASYVSTGGFPSQPLR